MLMLMLMWLLCKSVLSFRCSPIRFLFYFSRSAALADCDDVLAVCELEQEQFDRSYGSTRSAGQGAGAEAATFEAATVASRQREALKLSGAILSRLGRRDEAMRRLDALIGTRGCSDDEEKVLREVGTA